MEKLKMLSVEMSPIVQGFWRLTEWNTSADEVIKFINQCVDRGVTTIDTAEIYGDTECESQLGRALAKDPAVRRKLEIVSKTGIFRHKGFAYYNTTYNSIKASCTASIKRLGCEYLDAYLIHREDPCMDPWEAGRALTDLKKEGLIREFGVSNFDPFKLNAINTATEGQIVTNQIEWNPLCYEHFQSGMMDYLTEKKIRPMIWSPLAGGEVFTKEGQMYTAVRNVLNELAEKYDTCPATIIYAWIMYHPAGALPISGSNKINRLQQAIDALDIKLDHWDWYKLYCASDKAILR